MVDLLLRLGLGLFLLELLSGAISEALGRLAAQNEGRRGLTALKTAMSKNSPLDTIRNKVAFHADGEFLRQELIATEPGRKLTATIATDLLNTMYVFTEHLSVRAAARAVDESATTQEGVDALFELVTSVAGSAMAFLNDAIALTMFRHEVAQLPDESISVGDCPDLNDLRLPFLLQPVQVKFPEAQR
jgi:hypothetical protein